MARAAKSSPLWLLSWAALMLYFNSNLVATLANIP